MFTSTDSIDAMRASIAGLGAFLARSRLVETHLERGELVRLPGPALKARFAYYAVYPSNHRLSEPAAAFVQWMRDEASRPDARAPRSR